MPVTFNANNNYDVEIITELDNTNPTVVQQSSLTNRPFVEIKITPTDGQLYPVLASNLNIDNIISSFVFTGINLQPPACEPPLTPHGVLSSSQHNTSISPSYLCITSGYSSFNGPSNQSLQGPYSVDNDPLLQANQVSLNNVAWENIVLIEVYEDDYGVMHNDSFSPATQEDWSYWNMWVTATGQEITTNIYPKYIKAFVYLDFGGGSLGGLTSNTTLNLDIDEVEPIYGCTDTSSNVTNYNASATIDDGSCQYSGNTYGFQVNVNIHTGNMPGTGISAGPYTDGSTYTMIGPSGTTFTYTTNNWAVSMAPSYPHGNISLDPTAGAPVLTKTIILPNTYAVGATVNDIVTFYVYPTYGNVYSSWPSVFDFPYVGGPTGSGGTNLSSFGTGTEQRMFWGWGNTKNNLTAASLSIQSPVSPNYGWNDAIYIDPANSSFSPNMSLWHFSADITGLQPTEAVSFSNLTTATNSSITSSIEAQEFYNPNPPSGSPPGLQYFPEKILVAVQLDFVMSAGAISSQNLNYNDNYELDFNVRHDTKNQGTI